MHPNSIYLSIKVLIVCMSKTNYHHNLGSFGTHTSLHSPYLYLEIDGEGEASFEPEAWNREWEYRVDFTASSRKQPQA